MVSAIEIVWTGDSRPGQNPVHSLSPGATVIRTNNEGAPVVALVHAWLLLEFATT